MYCVIQEIETRKSNKNGHPKELISYYNKMSFGGEDWSRYDHHYGNECFERPVKKAYKISIHVSYREDGKVKKKQYPLCTANYYELAEGWFNPYDFCSIKIKLVAKELGVIEDEIYKLVYAKLDTLSKALQDEFQQTEEYKTHQEYEYITTVYAIAKTQFNNNYGFEGTSNEYDKCYDVFGNLMNEAYLEKIKANYVFRQEYEEKSRSYQENYYSNHNSNSKSSYSDLIHSNHDSEDKATLKQFYRVLSKKFHPDSNPDSNTSEEMKLLNKLKDEWGV